ncbi:EAL domain-containing protein [Evansella tamaricis]|uniref:EAL domain-containing protein n=1 Tax=Evansella tamaricis TaxID=2069301 RepID=A0ABS6JGQ0_9BACI|nr:EAL domain-containing protein [Evansella tamaricis]MBU9712844.1 EAL domain-containing protein [Evansella tamaricis]
MKMKTKVFSISLVSVTTFLLILFLIINPVLLERYSTIEEDIMVDNIKRVENVLNNEFNRLNMVVRDYAVWDDTYQFIQEKNQEYIQSNWVNETFRTNNIELVIYFDENSQIIYQNGYDVHLQKSINLLEKLNINDIYSFLNQRKTKIVKGTNNPIIISSHPIYPSLENKAAKGTLLMGIVLDNDLVEHLAESIQLPIKLGDIDYTGLTNGHSLEVLDNHYIQGAYYFPYENEDSHGEISFILERTIYKSGQESLRLFYIIYTVFSIFMTGMVLIFLDRHILSRVTNLSEELLYIQETKDLHKRITPKSGDEMGTLEEGFNHMLDSLLESQEEVHELAVTDSLTGIPNRKNFVENLNHWIQEMPENHVYVMFLDIDLFKRINDTLGHHSGDAILKELAYRLQNGVGKGNLVGRWGGDEFVIAIQQNKFQTPSEIAESLMDLISNPVNLGSFSFDITTSIGISEYPTDGNNGENLIQKADIAMYEAKRAGKNKYHLYKDMNTLSYFQNFVKLEKELKHGIKNKEFILYYQPIMEGKNKICGLEALIRWDHPKRGMISPGEFIPFAEEIGLMPEIGEWVLCEGLRQLKEWHLMGYHSLTLSINASKAQMMDNRFFDLIREMLVSKGISPSKLGIEITESDVCGYIENIMEFTNQLKEIGVKVSLDDFGTGLSSLKYLKEIQVDQIKFDRSFTNNIPINDFDSALLSGMFTLCERLDIEVVAEGVETEDQFLYLQKMNQKMQGYYFSKPVSAEQITKLLQTYEF